MNIEIISAIIGAVMAGVVGIITAAVSQRLKAKRTKKECISGLLSEVNLNQKKLQEIIKFFHESKKMQKANISPFDLFPEKLHFDKTTYIALGGEIGLLDSKTKENLLNYYEDLSVLEKFLKLKPRVNKDTKEVLAWLTYDLIRKDYSGLTDPNVVYKKGEELIKSLGKQS